MSSAFRFASALLQSVIGALLWLAVKLERLRKRLPRFEGRLRKSLRRVLEAWQFEVGVPVEPLRRFQAGNRTAPHVEERLVRLHVEQPLLGTGQLRQLAIRVLGFTGARETVRRVLIRNQHLIVELEQARRERRRRIRVKRAGELWGLDFTLVWVLGFFPLWVLGVVDYQGSRLVAFEVVRWPTTAEVCRILNRAFDELGAPSRLLSDNGPQFRSAALAKFLAARGVEQTFTRPAHPWTNGRIERVFRTFKQTVAPLVWLFDSRAQVERFCADFLLWHNRDRPHSAWGGRTPEEVFFGRPVQHRPLGRVSYFDGLLRWYRFGT
jgi:putative transposase